MALPNWIKRLKGKLGANAVMAKLKAQKQADERNKIRGALGKR